MKSQIKIVIGVKGLLDDLDERWFNPEENLIPFNERFSESTRYALMYLLKLGAICVKNNWEALGTMRHETNDEVWDFSLLTDDIPHDKFMDEFEQFLMVRQWPSRKDELDL